MKFFIDNCVSKHFAEALRPFGVDVVHLQDLFPEDTADNIWIPKVCKQPLIAITCDRAQNKSRGKTAVELQLDQKHRGRAFFSSPNLRHLASLETSGVFFRCWENIISESSNIKSGKMYDFSETGKISAKHRMKL